MRKISITVLSYDLISSFFTEKAGFFTDTGETDTIYKV